MVLFLDLSAPEPGHSNPALPPSSLPPNALSTILINYPILSTITHSIDLNTLHALSLTSRCIRAAILPYRALLVQQTLRCVHDGSGYPMGSLSLGLRRFEHEMMEDQSDEEVEEDTYSFHGVGKRWPCARDLVAECRRCGTVVCRNCTIKPSPSLSLLKRLRRLCPPCASAPLAALTPRFNSFPPAYCTCATELYICRACVVSLGWRDAEYQNLRKAFARFAAAKSGMESWEYEAVKLWPRESIRCWRATECVAVEEVEVEVEVDAELQQQQREGSKEGGNAGQARAGYEWQEMEGVGGGMKGKRRVKVGVGNWVAEGWDMQADGSALRRQQQQPGAAADPDAGRNWCGWCERVVLEAGAENT